MNTDKSYGQIIFEEKMKGDDILGWDDLPLERHNDYEDAAQAVIAAFKERETEEGWRLLEPDSVIAEGDQFCHRKWRNIWNFAGSAAIGSNVGTKELVRRRCRFLNDSHQQDERACSPPEPKAGASAILESSPAGGTIDPVCLMQKHARKLEQELAAAKAEVEAEKDLNKTCAAVNADMADMLVNTQRELATAKAQLTEARKKSPLEFDPWWENQSNRNEFKKAFCTLPSSAARMAFEAGRLELPPTSPWIACSERMPTKENADKDGHVICYRQSSGVFWHKYYATDRIKTEATHWLSYTPLPQPQDAAEKAWEQDRAENGSENSRWSKDDFMRGFNAALKGNDQAKP